MRIVKMSVFNPFSVSTVLLNRLLHMKLVKNVIFDSLKQFLSGEYSYQSSALAFTTLLALVPIFSVSLYVLSIFPFFNQLFALVKHYIFLNFVPTSSALIEQHLDQFSQQANQLPMTSMLFLLASIIMLVFLIKDIINAIWGSPVYKSRLFRLGHFIVILLMPIAIALGIYASFYLFTSYWVSTAANTLGLSLLLSILLPVFINTFIFTVLYIWVPSCHVRIRCGFWGGLIAAILFEIAKNIFVLYLRLFPSYELIYGALAVVPLFLLWLYISWSIIIYGAIVSKQLALSEC